MLSLIPLLAAGHISVADSLTAPGVSHELARYRAAHIRDVRYDLMLDLSGGGSVATGHVKIGFRRVNGGDVYVDFRGEDIGDVRVNGRRIAAVEYNRAHLRFETEAL